MERLGHHRSSFLYYAKERYMQEVLNLLEEKNSCLKRFIDINEKQMTFINAGDFDDLNNFYAARENILDIIQRVDEMIGAASLNFQEKEDSEEVKISIQKNISDKADLVNRILTQDLEILSKIDRAKSEIIKELSGVKSGRKAIGAYKSGSEERNLDEEA